MFNPDQSQLVAVGIVFPVIHTCVVALRFRARRLSCVQQGLDDWMIVLGLIFAYMTNFVNVYGVFHAGLGLAQDQEQGGSNLAFGKIIFVQTLLYVVAMATIKVSILLFYKRIFVTKSFRVAVYLLITMTVGWMIGNVFSIIFAYTPVEGEWTRQGRKNIVYPAFLISTSAVSIVLDTATLTCPLLVIRQLNMSFRKKLIVSGIFLLGTMCVAASIVRMPYLVGYSRAIRSIAGGETHAWSLESLITSILLWGLVEVDIAVIAACLPTLGPLLHDRALESVVRSARSAISLRSHASDGSGMRKQRTSESTSSALSWVETTGTAGRASVYYESTDDRLAGGETNVIRKTTSFEVVREGDDECETINSTG